MTGVQTCALPIYLLSFHLRTCYSVGELGICSIFELQQFLLKVSNKVKQLGKSLLRFQKIETFATFYMTLLGKSTQLLLGCMVVIVCKMPMFVTVFAHINIIIYVLEIGRAHV